MTKHYTDEGTLLIRNSDIKDGKFEFGDNPIYLEKTFAEKNETRMHQIGDILSIFIINHLLSHKTDNAQREVTRLCDTFSVCISCCFS